MTRPVVASDAIGEHDTAIAGAGLPVPQGPARGAPRRHPEQDVTAMTRNTPDHDTIRSVVALAVRAPSIHNSQPWRWATGDVLGAYPGGASR